ncbi:MAG: hypothetical protein Q9166_001986 [cf. Caloplaca sp. 2 TL-2023]
MFMELPVSGIHRLFTAASSQSYKPPLESVTEESHTYDLLYPDFSALQQSQDQFVPLRHVRVPSVAAGAGSFDDRGLLDIQSPRDVRIIVAQDAIFSQQAKVIFDTHPPPVPPAVRLGTPTDPRGGRSGEGPPPAALSLRTNSTPESPGKTKHTRFFSFAQTKPTSHTEQHSPLSPLSEPQGAFGSPRPRRANIRPTTSEGETDQTRLAREGKEEVEALLDSMFGSTGNSVHSGTKLHVRPPGTTQAGSSPQSEHNPRSSDLGGPRRRRTPLTRSTTADDIHLASASASSQNPSVLITRLFTIDPSESLSSRLTTDKSHASPGSPEDQDLGSQHPRNPSSVSEIMGTKQIKCPTYALSLLLRLPSRPQQGWPSAPQMTLPLLPGSPGQSNFSIGGSWSEEKAPRGFLCSADRGIEQITSHWSLLTRLLDSLEAVMRRKISSLLANLDLAFLVPSPQSSDHMSSRGVNKSTKSPMKKVRQPSQRTIQLPGEALQHFNDIQHEAARFGQRVAVVLRTRRVITGQGRWSAWREEARCVGRWAGTREQNFFFFNLLTAFLGFHTDWLESLDGMRTQQYARSKRLREAGRLTRHQTVVVSADKIAARRLIFLLSAFLPSTTTAQPLDGAIAPKAVWTGSSISQSPKQSLFREINRRQRGNLASQGSRTMHTRSLSFAGSSSIPNSDGDNLFQDSSRHYTRRASDAKLIRSPALPIATSGESTRKSSTTTASTVVPDTAVHLSNVSNRPRRGTTPAPRPGSSGSLASLTLQYTIHRSESNEHSNASTASQSHSRWGSMVSGFWSNRRGSSTDDSEFIPPSSEGLGISGVSKMPVLSSSPGTLSRMVEEAETLCQVDPTFEASSTPARSIPERPKVEAFPVKLSVDDNDGIIDVELPPLNSRASSFGSSTGSTEPCASSYNDRASVSTHSPSKRRPLALSDAPNEVAGWLKEYNPDFVLHAVRPYGGLDKDIKEAMKSESAAQLSRKRAIDIDTTIAEWSDEMSTLVADTTTFSIRRLRLQHRGTEERIIEEPTMDMDPTLIDAVERVLAQSGHSSQVQSTTASRVPSPHRMAHRIPEIRTSTSRDDLQPMSMDGSHVLEVPRSECKTLVLGALEEVVRSVQAEQDAGAAGARRISGEPVRNGEETFPPDSTLREGVRRWLRGVGAIAGSS